MRGQHRTAMPPDRLGIQRLDKRIRIRDQRLVVHAKGFTVVRIHDDDRVLEQPLSLEHLHDVRELLVDACGRAQVVRRPARVLVGSHHRCARPDVGPMAQGQVSHEEQRLIRLQFPVDTSDEGVRVVGIGRAPVRVNVREQPAHQASIHHQVEYRRIGHFRDEEFGGADRRRDGLRESESAIDIREAHFVRGVHRPVTRARQQSWHRFGIIDQFARQQVHHRPGGMRAASGQHRAHGGKGARKRRDRVGELHAALHERRKVRGYVR